MKIHPIIADTGRPIGTAASLLNAGWTFTTAVPLSDGVELLDDEGQPAHLLTPTNPQPVRVEQEITIPSVPNAPNGTPGLATALFELPQGTIRIAAARRRYIWRVTVRDVIEEVGFWVNAPMVAPRIGIGDPGTVPPQT